MHAVQYAADHAELVEAEVHVLEDIARAGSCDAAYLKPCAMATCNRDGLDSYSVTSGRPMGDDEVVISLKARDASSKISTKN